MPTIEQLASQAVLPAADVESAIVSAVEDDLRFNGNLNPYRVHAATQQAHPDVTIGQVARVLIERELAS